MIIERSIFRMSPLRLRIPFLSHLGRGLIHTSVLAYLKGKRNVNDLKNKTTQLFALPPSAFFYEWSLRRVNGESPLLTRLQNHAKENFKKKSDLEIILTE
jgi:hypothetical protein